MLAAAKPSRNVRAEGVFEHSALSLWIEDFCRIAVAQKGRVPPIMQFKLGSFSLVRQSRLREIAMGRWRMVSGFGRRNCDRLFDQCGANVSRNVDSSNSTGDGHVDLTMTVSAGTQ
ncbi:hypothetical protein PMI07_006516 [Rhizobium sp. CF080]|uniref:hypothetical protein n=1 Tax=Rhizobium sp. (strain CF080) TaxID=1144310 RepID=UPI00027178C1|nr:hypothetical protein [Rhizobium sp. CF080]EUB98202.1 hypothetical protein PMI07_006516 [Rhizobium sp. CF080]